MVAQALGEKVGALLKVVGHRWGRSGPCPSPRGALPVVAGLPPRTAGCRGGAGAVAEEGMQQGILLRLGCCEPGPARGQQEQKQRQKQEEAEEGGGEGPPGRPPSSNRDGGGGVGHSLWRKSARWRVECRSTAAAALTGQGAAMRRRSAKGRR